jgi:putative ABC transport system permease protein
MKDIIDINYLTLLMGFFLMIIPILVFLYYKTKLVKATLLASIRMTVQLLLVGLYLEYIFDLNSVLLNCTWVLVMALISSYTIIQRSGLRFRKLFIPVLLSVIITIVFIDAYLLGFIIKLDNVFDARYFIPVTGMVLGNMIKNSIIFLNSFYKKIDAERDLCRWYMANGANKKESLLIFVQHALKVAFNPMIAAVAIVGLISLPGVMTGQILGGSNPNVAVKYQIILMITIFVASILNIVLVMLFSKHVAFDKYGNLNRLIFR